jgi:hypothetical protein
MISTRHDGWVIFSLSVTNLLVEGGIKNTVPVVYVALTCWPGVGRLFGQPARLPVTA